VRRNGDDMRRLLRYGRRPHDRPEEGVVSRSSAEMGAALSADRRRSRTPVWKVMIEWGVGSGRAGVCCHPEGATLVWDLPLSRCALDSSDGRSRASTSAGRPGWRGCRRAAAEDPAFADARSRRTAP